ncbi:MAG TPA: hypothetical protein HPP83_00510 [Candidatus Hydrogenedentes bacterium]|nr:hypothetical protein [Candidatus Hydrogenedentota bacterium]
MAKMKRRSAGPRSAAGRVTLWAIGIAALCFATSPVHAESGRDPHEGWNFKFKDFVIAAWSPPATTDAEYRLYKDAGFNVVMTPRNQFPDEALALAEKYGLAVMIDTYTPHGRPWGGVEGDYFPHPAHHPATFPELKWLVERYGDHPALAGILLGDDIGPLPPQLVKNTRWMREHAPHLIPWVCQCIYSPESLAEHGNPIYNPQFYPTLFAADLPAWEQAELYCSLLDSLRESAGQHNLTPWPFFNVSAIERGELFESDSLLRFQVYASLAYGAQGIWYFTYRGCGSLFDGKEVCAACGSSEEASAYIEPNWFAAKEVNHRVAAWGPELLGRKAAKVYHSGPWPAPPAEDAVVRTDKTLFFNWELGPPVPAMPADDFEVTWTGYIRSKSFDEVTFTTVSNDGVRLWVDGKKIIDNWTDHFAVEDTGKIQLPLAKMVPIRVEYYEKDSLAALILYWSSPTLPREIVPSDCLFTDTDGGETGLRGEYRALPSRLWRNSLRPGRDELVVKMSNDLLVGILTKPGEAPLAMVVDKRVDTRFRALDHRTVKVRFADAVQSLTMLDEHGGQRIDGHTIRLTLPAGGGQLLRLDTKAI